MSPRNAADLEWPLSEGMQISALPPVWIAMIISCWSVKLLKLLSVTLTHVCGTNSHNWWAKGLPGVGVGVGVVKIICDSDSSGWKSFRLRLLDSDSTALVKTSSFVSVVEATLYFQLLRSVYNKQTETKDKIPLFYPNDFSLRKKTIAFENNEWKYFDLQETTASFVSISSFLSYVLAKKR